MKLPILLPVVEYLLRTSIVFQLGDLHYLTVNRAGRAI